MKTVRSAIVAGFATVALLVAPSLAQAAQGFIVAATDLRAGPDDQFPPVDQIQAGAEVEVFGCLQGNIWCDVAFQQDRGWVSGQDLEVVYQSQRVKAVEVQVEVVPLVTFEVATYWDRHYHDKPFFKDRDHFASININIDNGGKAAPGKTGSGGQAAVTGSVNGKETGGKAATGGAGAQGQASANANAACPNGDKNCKTEGNAGGGVKAMTGGKAATGGAPANDKTANGGAVNGKTANGGEVTGSMGAKGAMPNAKDCKPGTAGCPKGGGNTGGGPAPAQ